MKNSNQYPMASQYLKEGVTLEQLDAIAAKMSDNDAALALNNARRQMVPDHRSGKQEAGMNENRHSSTTEHVSTRPRQNSGQRLRFADRRSDSFPDWKRLKRPFSHMK